MCDRVYSPGPMGVGDLVSLTGPEAHHLARVRRCGPGDEVELFDGRGRAWIGRVDAIGKGTVAVRIESGLPPRERAAVSVTLASAVPKGERFDWLVEKATELGVDRLIPLRTERSVVDPGAGKLDRLRRLAVEACKQCGRDRLMELDDPRPWGEVVDDGPGLIAHPGAGTPIGHWRPADRVSVAIGPEGGWTDDEVDRAIEAGWTGVGLGATVLRVETAGLAACAALLALANRSEG